MEAESKQEGKCLYQGSAVIVLQAWNLTAGVNWVRKTVKAVSLL